MSKTTTSAAVRTPAGAVPPRPPARGHLRRRNLTPLWLLSPAGIVILILTVGPILFLIFSSFTDYDQRSLFTGEFHGVGVEQYARIFTDPDFWWSSALTVIFTAAMVVGSVAIGMAVAQLLTRVSSAVKHAITVVLILAWAMPNVASSVVWKWLFQPGYGVVNWLLTQLRVFGDMTYVNWGEVPFLAFLSIWLLIVWQAVPFIALTLYAAQTQIPIDHLEAARLDGASEWRTYWSIVVHALKPTLLLLSVLSIIWDFNVFNQIWLVTQGGPDNATATLGIWTYKTAFVGFDIGEGAAISVVTTLFLMAFTALYVRNLIRSGEDL
jgi:N,N'-diacetylchitobiose transport system permease protein